MVNAMTASFFALRAIMIYLSGTSLGRFGIRRMPAGGMISSIYFEGREPGINSRQQKQFKVAKRGPP